MLPRDQTFGRSWQATVLAAAPAILPTHRYVFPCEAEEVERGAVFVSVQPANGPAWLGIFALGFADPALPSGVWSCPDPDQLCVLAGGYAYLVDSQAPTRFEHLPFRPVYAVLPVAAPEALLVFAGSRTLLAYGQAGRRWESPRVSDEGLRALHVEPPYLHGLGWRLRSDREEPFRLSLDDGRER